MCDCVSLLLLCSATSNPWFYSCQECIVSTSQEMCCHGGRKEKKKKTIGGSTTSGLQPWQGNLLRHPSLPCICVYLHVDSWSLPPREYRLQKRSLAVPCCQLPNRWVSLNAPPTLVVAKHLAGSTLAPILPVDTQRQHASATRY